MSILRCVVKSNSTLPNDATVGASSNEVHVSASLQSPADSCQLFSIGEPPTTFIELPEMEATRANVTSEVNVKAADFLLPECPNQPNLSCTVHVPSRAINSGILLRVAFIAIELAGND